MWPVFINAGWGLVCHFALPATPEAHARKEAAEKAALTGTTLNTVPEEPAKRGITIKEALQIPSVAGYCVAFGFMKTINYVLSVAASGTFRDGGESSYAIDATL